MNVSKTLGIVNVLSLLNESEACQAYLSGIILKRPYNGATFEYGNQNVL